MPLALTYPAVKKLLADHAMRQRTESRQFLAWFLANYYRLEETDVDDCICDGKDDKGIDGIYVNDQLAHIDVFQSRLATKRGDLGDSELREFFGSVNQMLSAQSVNLVASSTKNKDLADRIVDQDIARKVDEGYKVRGVFLTNMKRNKDAIQYLATAPDIILYDEQELQQHYVAIDKTAPISSSILFRSSDKFPLVKYPISSDMDMVLVPLLASDLVKMHGISSGELFAWNVRQFLSRKTKVNQDIENTIGESAEHRYFQAFHNGITVLCNTLDVSGRTITISGYAVVNGCQSLSVLNENKGSLTDTLRVLTKFVRVPPDSSLARKITERTNNQNGITARDLQSNNVLQTRLQSEIANKYSKEYNYRIKRGEHPEWDKDARKTVIENELAARILLAFDLKEPWTCHQTYKLFDELHSKIFGRQEVTADRIVVVYEIYEAAREHLPVIGTAHELFSKYSLTRFLLLYLVREALETSETGNALISRPSDFISEEKGRKRIRYSVGALAKTIAKMLGKEVERRNKSRQDLAGESADPFDYKRELKSPNTVRALQSTVIGTYENSVDNEFVPSFDRLWRDSKKKSLR